METLRILVVEDDSSTCEAFVACADAWEDVEIVGVSHTAKEAIQSISDHLPHAVILDLELHRGGGSGLDVLQGVRDAALSYKPFFLITTVNTSNAIYDYARSLGADYILYKHQEGYSEKYALDFLRNMRAIIHSSNGRMQTTETPHQRESRIRQRIKAEFYHVGISPKMQGYPYLVDSVELFIQAPQQKLCAAIAEKYGKSTASVERAMQNAIDKAWKTTDVDELVHHFKAKIRSDKGVPTIMEFVCYYADMIKAEY